MAGGTGPLEVLPHACISEVLRFCGGEHCMHMIHVCRSMRKIAAEEPLWRRLYRYDYGEDSLVFPVEPKPCWREAYQFRIEEDRKWDAVSSSRDSPGTVHIPDTEGTDVSEVLTDWDFSPGTVVMLPPGRVEVRESVELTNVEFVGHAKACTLLRSIA